MTALVALLAVDSAERVLVRVLQFGLLAISLYGAVTANLAIAVNGLVALGVTLLPAALRREYDYRMNAGLVLWITVALVLHTVGFLGFYDQYSWYDEIAHTVSASLVAGFGYATFRAIEVHSDHIELPTPYRSLFIVIFVLAAGVVWEVLEFGVVVLSNALGIDDIVTVYGIDDIVTDFVYNTLGAILVAIWGTGYFDGVVRVLIERLAASSRADDE